MKKLIAFAFVLVLMISTSGSQSTMPKEQIYISIQEAKDVLDSLKISLDERN